MTPEQLREVCRRAAAYADNVEQGNRAMNPPATLDRYDIERAYQLGFAAGFEAGKQAGYNAARGTVRKK